MIAVWYDPDCDQIWITDAERPYPPLSLVAFIDSASNRVGIRSKFSTGSDTITPYTNLADRSGNGFGSTAEAKAYLDGEFAKRRTVGSPERNYALPSASGWPIFALSPEPADVNTVALLVNGVAYHPPDIGASTLSVSWQGPFPLDMTDAVRVVYF